MRGSTAIAAVPGASSGSFEAPGRQTGKRPRSVLVRQPAAGVRSPADVDGGIALLYKLNLALLVDDEAGAVGQAPFGHQHTVGRGSLAVDEIAEKGKCKRKLLCKLTKGRGVIAADSEDLRVSSVIF
jgi:hypothetical protein